MPMNIYQIDNIKDKKQFLKDLNVHGGGVSIMAKKMELLYFFIKDLKTPAAPMLKASCFNILAAGVFKSLIKK